jgi:hypothetical protein
VTSNKVSRVSKEDVLLKRMKSVTRRVFHLPPVIYCSREGGQGQFIPRPLTSPKSTELLLSLGRKGGWVRFCCLISDLRGHALGEIKFRC